MLTSLKRQTFKRCYVESSNVFGYRTAKEYNLPDYSKEELENRVENSNLLRLVENFRQFGHKSSRTDPLEMRTVSDIKELSLKEYGLNESDGLKYNLKGILHLNNPNNPQKGLFKATIKDIYKYLTASYCGSIGYEFSHLNNQSEQRWFQYMVESFEKPKIDKQEKLRIHSLLTKSEEFDHFMHKKFPSLKRYGLEGGESFLVSLDYLLESAASYNLDKVVLCTAHRGRLNMLTGVLQFPLSQLFHKVKGNYEFPNKYKDYFYGDVISHLAIDKELSYNQNKINISLLHNPSHLEAINPVALGHTRAHQMDLMHNSTPNCQLGDKAMCVQIHGDSAFCGQGVVMESLGISNLPHFSSGGSIHIIINNQIGYTTQAANYRSSVYSSDVGKMINCPVIHVNGDHPEQVAIATKLACDYRHKFRKDVILDLVCFRRHGHNEVDEPGFTQPSMYKKIANRLSCPVLYENKLKKENISTEELNANRVQYQAVLQKGFEDATTYVPELPQFPKWSLPVPHENQEITTGILESELVSIGNASVVCPSEHTVHPRLKKYHIQDRLDKILNKQVDWATAEAMAIGSLLKENVNVRISGQDVGRGTFSQRHFMFVDQKTEDVWIPLNMMTKEQSHLEVANSSLSEFAVMGFEFGFSWYSPNVLTIWEAQFGSMHLYR